MTALSAAVSMFSSELAAHVSRLSNHNNRRKRRPPHPTPSSPPRISSPRLANTHHHAPLPNPPPPRHHYHQQPASAATTGSLAARNCWGHGRCGKPFYAGLSAGQGMCALVGVCGVDWCERSLPAEHSVFDSEERCCGCVVTSAVRGGGELLRIHLSAATFMPRFSTPIPFPTLKNTKAGGRRPRCLSTSPHFLFLAQP